MVWNGGCIRKYPLNCSDGEGFVAFKGMIVPNLSKFSLDTKSRSNSKEKKKKLLLVIIPVLVALLSFLLASCVMWKRIKQTRDYIKDDISVAWIILILIYHWSIMGQLSTGQAIAVKRLSENSKQGLSEFKNEAWKLWIEGNAIQLVDKKLETSAMLTIFLFYSKRDRMKDKRQF
ncbi:hypothetical protein HYC85_017756 [Camellia sinensis]|uniref:Uncharacterized protein n=1 Tax=Camellia sinensis TaxID=4442 RepID=A0A7J7GSB0_CAMSI|nr:hypothetical protein HYC85_017756 [Camellia sinensis]